MRERAARIEGSLSVWSEANAGTEIELAVPGAVAYRTFPIVIGENKGCFSVHSEIILP